MDETDEACVASLLGGIVDTVANAFDDEAPEEWRVCRDHENVFENYEVSNRGNVRNKSTLVMLRPAIVSGYRGVTISAQGKLYGRRVSRLVLFSFVGPPPAPHMTADHIDSSQPLNDALSNLRWATPSQQADNRRPKSLVRSATPIVGIAADGTRTLFDSATHAARELKCDISSITKVLKGKRTTPLVGHRFEYAPLPPDLEGEEWRPVVIKNRDTGVFVSNMNRIRDERGPPRIFEVPDLISERSTDKYPRLVIDGKQHKVHVLVLEAFVGPRPDNHVAHHVDHDTTNASLDNLQWITRGENSRAAWEAGRFDSSEQLKPVEFDGVTYPSQRAAAEALGVHEVTIMRRIKRARDSST